MNEKPVRPRRKYDLTFKREAVLNWLRSGKSAEVVGAELGIGRDLFYSWKHLAGGATFATTPPMAKPGSNDLKTQLEEAQRELRHVREQCLILKKTLGILSEPSPNGMNGFKP